jgi:hypothetical protein
MIAQSSTLGVRFWNTERRLTDVHGHVLAPLLG